MLGRGQHAVGPHRQHLPGTDDERVPPWRHGQPGPVRQPDIEAAHVFLGEQGEHLVVRVAADAHGRPGGMALTRVVQQPQLGHGLAGPRGEVPLWQAEAERDHGEHRVGRVPRRGQVRLGGSAEAGDLRPLVGARPQPLAGPAVAVGVFEPAVVGVDRPRRRRGVVDRHVAAVLAGAGVVHREACLPGRGEERPGRVEHVRAGTGRHGMPGDEDEPGPGQLLDQPCRRCRAGRAVTAVP